MNWKLLARYFFLPSAMLVGAATLLVGGIYRAQMTAHVEAVSEEEQLKVLASQARVTDHLQQVLTDLRYLAMDEALIGALDGDLDAMAEITRSFLHFASAKPIYQQIRLLDARGIERVRVDGGGNGPTVIATTSLQDKSDRYYIAGTSTLDRGEVFVSRLDLNVEHGAIEQPFAPVIRFGTSLFREDGERVGMLLLNCLTAHMLDRALPEPLMLLDSDGYWLVGGEPRDRFGFMLGHERTFAQAHPSAWARIESGDEGVVLLDDGLFAFQTVSALRRDPGEAARVAPTWKLVSWVRPDALRAHDALDRVQPLYSLLAVLLVALVGLATVALCLVIPPRSEGSYPTVD